MILQLRKRAKRGLGRPCADNSVHKTHVYASSILMRHVRRIVERTVTELRRLRSEGS